MEQRGIACDGELTILAFLMPEGLVRQEAKREMIALLAQSGLLSATYLGDAPIATRRTADEPYSSWLRLIRHRIAT